MSILGVMLAFFAFSPFASAQQSPETVDGKIHIKLTESGKAQVAGEGNQLPNAVPKAQTGVPELNQVARRYGVKRMERVFRPAGKHEARHVEWGLDRWYTVKYDGSADPATVASAYLNTAQVEAGSPVYKKKKAVLTETPSWVDDEDSGEESASESRRTADKEQSFVPNDPEYGSQWHYNNTVSNPGTPDADINLPEAHDVQTGQPSVVVSVVDAGLDLDHPEFQGMLWTNEDEIPGNGIDDDNNGFVDDVHGYDHAKGDGEPNAFGDHGTHVAGTVAAKNGNGQFGAGVAGGDGSPDSGVRLMINKTFGSANENDGFAEAVVYAADNGAVVSQNSWGYRSEGFFDQPVLDAIDYFRANAGGPSEAMDGGIYVNASGNNDSNGDWYPGVYPGSYAVSATDPNDTKAGYSNYGDWIDVAAPGGDGLPYDDGDVQSTVVGGFGPLGGTSMAAPHVSGVIGLVVSENPGMTNEAVEQLLKDTGVDISANQPERMGPRIDAAAAVASVAGDDTPPAPVEDLAATEASSSEPGAAVELTWTAPGDDGEEGTADSYDIRYSLDGPIDDSTSFANAQMLDGEPIPDTAGTAQNYTAEGLPFSSEVYFAIQTSDLAGNASDPSNSPSIMTTAGPVASFTPDTLETEITVGQTETVTATLTNDGSVGFQYSIDEAELPDYLSVSPAQDSIPAGGSAEIDMTFDASGLRIDLFEASVVAQVDSQGVTSTASIHTLLDVNTAEYPFAVDTESISATLTNPADAPSEEATQTVMVTNESDDTKTLEIYGGAAASGVGTLVSPLYNGDKLRDWRRKKQQSDGWSTSREMALKTRYEGGAETRDAPSRPMLDVSPSSLGSLSRLTGNASSSVGNGTGLGDSFIKLPVDNPAAASAIGPAPTAFAGNFGYNQDDNYFVITDADNAFHSINAETGEITTLGTSEPENSYESWNEIATDPTDGTLYAGTAGDPSGTGTWENRLYRLDTETGEAQLVTEVNSDGLINAYAMNGEGQLFGLNVSNGNLLEIDKETGAVATVGGPVSIFPLNFQQGMDFDLKSGKLYISATETFFGSIFGGQVYEVNPQTAESVFIGSAGGGNGAVTGHLAFPSVGFVEPSLTQVTLSPGSSIPVEMTLNADRLSEGEYNSDVFMRADVAGQPSENINVTMNVDGESKLVVAPSGDEALAFDSTIVQDTSFADQPVTIRNTGTADLEATISAGDQFTPTQQSVSLIPGEAETFDVQFTPTKTGSFEQELTISSEDSTDTITLEGVATPRPVAQLSQESFDVQMYPGQNYTRTLSMSNAGEGELEFVGTEESVQLPSQNAIAPPADAEGFEDGVPPEGWETLDEPGEGVTWKSTEEFERGNYTGSGLAAHVDSDANQDTPYDARLISPVKTFEEGTILNFDLNFQVIGDEQFDVDVSTDGGSTWTTVRTFDEDTGEFEGEGVNIVIPNDTLSNYIGLGDTFQVRFRYWTSEAQPWDWYAQVDNVAFSRPTEFFTFEPKEGTVAPGETADLNLAFDATNIASGTYQVDMVFDTNDPAGDDGDGTITVPVTIDVIEALSVTPEHSDGDDEVFPSETYTLNMNVESLDDLEVFSYQMEMGFNTDRMQVQEVTTEGTLSEGLTLTSNIDNENGVVTIAAADDGMSGSSSGSGDSDGEVALFDIKGEGVLVSIEATGQPDHGEMVMDMQNVVFNEGQPPATPVNDTMEVVPLYGDTDLNLSVNTGDASTTLDFVVGSTDLIEAKQTHADVSGDDAVSAFDASLILQRTVGLIPCFPAEAGCEQGTEALATTSKSSSKATASFAWGEVTEPKQATSAESEKMQLPLVLNQAGQSVRAIDVTTKVDPDKVAVNDMTAQLPDDWRAVHHVSDDGTLKISMAGTTPISNAGKVATLTMEREESDATLEMGGNVTVNEGAAQKLETKSIVSIPDEFALEGAYPNPFRQAATLEMDLPQKANVTVEVYDLLGRKVQTAHRGEMAAGSGRTVQISGSDLSSGTYFYRARVEMDGNRVTETGKMTVVR